MPGFEKLVASLSVGMHCLREGAATAAAPAATATGRSAAALEYFDSAFPRLGLVSMIVSRHLVQALLPVSRRHSFETGGCRWPARIDII